MLNFLLEARLQIILDVLIISSYNHSLKNLRIIRNSAALLSN